MFFFLKHIANLLYEQFVRNAMVPIDNNFQEMKPRSIFFWVHKNFEILKILTFWFSSLIDS